MQNFKTNKEIEKEIGFDVLYKPSEIVKNGWIYNKKKYTYDFVLKLIRLKRLKAKNVGFGKKNHYRVKGLDVIKYIREYQ